MDRAGAANLIARSADGHETRQLKYLSHSSPRANFGKVNTRHRQRPYNREEELVFRSGNGTTNLRKLFPHTLESEERTFCF
jgi:hypothetical protein